MSREYSIVHRDQAHFVPIDRPAQLKALAAPVRQEVVDVLSTAGPCSMAELGERLGRAPDALYFHVRRLVRVGLVVEVGRRKLGRHAFAVYDAVGRPLRIDRKRARREDLQAVVRGIMRLAIRDYERASRGAAAVGEGPARNHWGARVHGWLDELELARANELLEELERLIRNGRPAEGRQPVALAWLLAPVPPRGRGRKAAPSRARAPSRSRSSKSNRSSRS
jgi:DNA-binding transcriptional ArsR family regulator